MTKTTKGVLVYVVVMLALVCATFNAALPAGWPTNYQHFNDIRESVYDLPKWTHLRFTLNNGDVVFGEYLGYEKYNDYIWYQPQGTGRNWFKQDAFDVHEIFRIDIIVEEPV